MISPESSEQGGISPPKAAGSLPVTSPGSAWGAHRQGGLQLLLFRRRTEPKAGKGAEAVPTDF